MVGVRDEIVIRLGLLGMRLAEIGGVTVDSVRLLPAIAWTGKGRKPRRATAGPALRDALGSYLDAYPQVQPSSPLICRQVLGAARQAGARRLDWHHRASNRSLFVAVTGRAQAAGLGHLARTTCAGQRRGSCTAPSEWTGRTTSICWTSNGSSATATRRPPCAATWSRWTPTCSTGPPLD
jgi:integrase